MRLHGLLVASLLLVACRSPGQVDSVREAVKVATWEYRIQDPTGVPLAGARGFWILDRRPARDAETALRETVEGKVDDDGVLRLVPPPPDADGYLSVWVETTDGPVCVDEGVYPQGEVRWTVEPEPYEVPERDRRFLILVVDENRVPVSGAIAVLCRSPEGAPLPFHPALRGDDRGFLRRGNVAYGSYWADLEAPGCAPVRVCPYQFSGPDEAEDEGRYFGPVVLPPGRSVRGRLLADGRRPPNGAWVRLSYDSTRPNERCEWYLAIGSEGEFEARVRADAPWSLEVGAPGRKSHYEQFESETDVVLELPPASQPVR